MYAISIYYPSHTSLDALSTAYLLGNPTLESSVKSLYAYVSVVSPTFDILGRRVIFKYPQLRFHPVYKNRACNYVLHSIHNYVLYSIYLFATLTLLTA